MIIEEKIASMIEELARDTKLGFNEMGDRIAAVDGKVDNLDIKVENLASRVTRLETTVVTKDYLDEKLAILRGDLISVIRREDGKITWIAEKLSAKKVLSKNESLEFADLPTFRS